ncbi:lamin tail domain-containing protein [Candidatus Woesearchaeota archaeon]|nr:lamin tail domain-containing protein [Candidatus Woesearchaeota archaeon]
MPEMLIKSFSPFVVAAVIILFYAHPAAAAAANGNVIISQVLYDPANSESGGEAVELYNPTAFSVNLSGWALATETSQTDLAFPANAVICSGCYYLAADAGWPALKDNSSWPNADFEEAMTLANTDAGVALKDTNSTVIDAVGWGSAANIGPGLFEGTPHSGGGNALKRKEANGSYIDTNNNTEDFAEVTPDFRNSNSSRSSAANSNAEIQVTIVVSGSGPTISLLRVLTDDDGLLPGIQVSPVPKSNRTVNVEAVVADDNGLQDISAVSLAFNGTNFIMAKKSEINTTAATYHGSFNMSGSFPAGNHTISVTATDNSGFIAGSSAGFEYMTMAAIEADASSVVFFASPGLAYEMIGDNSAETAANITISNVGNVMLDFDVWATNFTSGSSVMDASMLSYTLNGNYSDPKLGGAMANAKARKDVNLRPEATLGLSLKLNVPLATSPGNYSGRISLVAVDSG